MTLPPQPACHHCEIDHQFCCFPRSPDACGRFLYPIACRHNRFNFSELDTKSAHLHLMIETATKRDPPICRKSCEITGQVTTRSKSTVKKSRRKYIGGERQAV